jgi:hypothetical protein
MKATATSTQFCIMNRAIILGLVLLGLASRAGADITYLGAGGSLTATVAFAQSGTDLIITLSNTTLADVQAQEDVLTAVFFTLAGNPVLTKTSAVVPAGSTVYFGITDPGGVVGGEWAYNPALKKAPFDAQLGIGSAGFSANAEFDGTMMFPGNNLDGNAGPDGISYGILSAGDNTTTGNSAVTGGNPLIKNSVVFTMGLPTNYVLTASSISDVSFQYGTALNEPNDPGALIPEPSSIALAAAGIGLLGLFGRRRR